MPEAKEFAGKDMAVKLIDNLFLQDNKGPLSEINVLLSVGYTDDVDFILGFMRELNERNLPSKITSRIGWDVGMNEPIDKIIEMWKRLEIVNNIWQGDGRTNCVSPILNIKRLTQIIESRDNDVYINKIYHWTIDLTASLRTSLRTGVDGIITNHPERIVNILQEKEFVNVIRLAKHSDSAWTKVEAMKKSPISSSTTDKPSRWVSDLNDKADSITKYLKEFVSRPG